MLILMMIIIMTWNCHPFQSLPYYYKPHFGSTNALLNLLRLLLGCDLGKSAKIREQCFAPPNVALFIIVHSKSWDILGDLPRCLKLSPFSITFILTQATFWVHKCAPQFAAHFARVWPRKICQNQGAMFCTPKIWLSLSLHKRKQSVLGANNNNNEHNNDGIMI